MQPFDAAIYFTVHMASGELKPSAGCDLSFEQETTLVLPLALVANAVSSCLYFKMRFSIVEYKHSWSLSKLCKLAKIWLNGITSALPFLPFCNAWNFLCHHVPPQHVNYTISIELVVPRCARYDTLTFICVPFSCSAVTEAGGHCSTATVCKPGIKRKMGFSFLPALAPQVCSFDATIHPSAATFLLRGGQGILLFWWPLPVRVLSKMMCH